MLKKQLNNSCSRHKRYILNNFHQNSENVDETDKSREYKLLKVIKEETESLNHPKPLLLLSQQLNIFLTWKTPGPVLQMSFTKQVISILL